MPHYTFALRDGLCRVQDPAGVRLRNRSAARAYALQVAQELMAGRERETRTWCLEVYGDNGAGLCSIPFASIDPTLDHLTPDHRAVIEGWCDRARSLQEAISTARATVQESQALVARSRGKPYLAATNGKRTIRGG